MHAFTTEKKMVGIKRGMQSYTHDRFEVNNMSFQKTLKTMNSKLLNWIISPWMSTPNGILNPQTLSWLNHTLTYAVFLSDELRALHFINVCPQSS